MFLGIFYQDCLSIGHIQVKHSFGILVKNDLSKQKYGIIILHSV